MYSLKALFYGRFKSVCKNYRARTGDIADDRAAEAEYK